MIKLYNKINSLEINILSQAYSLLTNQCRNIKHLKSRKDIVKLWPGIFLLFFLNVTQAKLERKPAYILNPVQLCSDAYSLFLIRQKDPNELAQKYLQQRIDNDMPIILDIGGEGRYVGAINLNPQPLVSNFDREIIPFWLPGRGDNIPLPNRIVDEIFLESAPLNQEILMEMLRVIRPRGKIHLSNPTDYANRYYDDLVETLQGAKIERIDDGMITQIEITLP